MGTSLGCQSLSLLADMGAHLEDVTLAVELGSAGSNTIDCEPPFCSVDRLFSENGPCMIQCRLPPLLRFSDVMLSLFGAFVLIISNPACHMILSPVTEPSLSGDMTVGLDDEGEASREALRCFRTGWSAISR